MGKRKTAADAVTPTTDAETTEGAAEPKTEPTADGAAAVAAANGETVGITEGEVMVGANAHTPLATIAVEPEPTPTLEEALRNAVAALRVAMHVAGTSLSPRASELVHLGRAIEQVTQAAEVVGVTLGG